MFETISNPVACKAFIVGNTKLSECLSTIPLGNDASFPLGIMVLSLADFNQVEPQNSDLAANDASF
jgi:hypothetical protein